MKDASLILYSASASRDFNSNGGLKYTPNMDLTHLGIIKKKKDPKFFQDRMEDLSELVKYAGKNKCTYVEKTKIMIKNNSICEVCKGPYEAVSPKRKTCSEKCRRILFNMKKLK